jgi:cation diffusion facilitator family transporter
VRELQLRKARVARVSVLSNVCLVIAKLLVAYEIGAVSVLSEAVHSGVDLLASIIAFGAVRLASAPADERHPYGYGKWENVSGVIEALLIFAGGASIVVEAVQRLCHPAALEAPFWGCAVMAASAVVNYAVSRLLFRVAEETDSVALRVDAWHLRSDVYTSLGVFASLTVILAAQRLAPTVRLDWVDPVAGLLVAALILRTAWVLTAEAGRELLDASIDRDEEERIHTLIASRADVRGYHALRTRKAGSDRFIDFHLVVDGNLTVEVSHNIAMEVSRAIETTVPGARVVTHVEPCLGRCTPKCRSGCLLPDAQREALHAAWQVRACVRAGGS